MFKKIMRFLGPISLLVCAIIWGASYPLVKDILDEISVYNYLALRFILTIPILVCFFYKPINNWRQKISLLSTEELKIILVKYTIPGVFLALAMITQAYGISLATPATAAFFTSLSFCFIPLLEFLHGYRDHLSHIILPLIVAFFGIIQHYLDLNI